MNRYGSTPVHGTRTGSHRAGLNTRVTGSKFILGILDFSYRNLVLPAHTSQYALTASPDRTAPPRAAASYSCIAHQRSLRLRSLLLLPFHHIVIEAGQHWDRAA